MEKYCVNSVLWDQQHMKTVNVSDTALEVYQQEYTLGDSSSYGNISVL